MAVKKSAKKAAKKAVTKTTAKKSAKKSAKAAAKNAVALPAKGKDPRGGLTAAGREFYNKQTGGNLKPGVKGAADSPEKMRRKGSFLTRHFTSPSGPVENQGKPTRQALQAAAWGEPVPKTVADEKKLASKGRALLDRYHKSKEAKGKA